MSFFTILERKRKVGSSPTVYTILIICCLISACIPLPTLPGSGMDLTSNLLCWIWVFLWGMLLTRYIWRSKCAGSLVTLGLLVALCALSLPLIWTPAANQQEAICRLLLIAGLMLFCFLLLQCPVRGRSRAFIYWLIVVAGLIQFILACWQIIVPDSALVYLGYDYARAGGRPLGTLMQVNLLGSFLSTALLSALWLALYNQKKWQAVVAWICVFLLSTGIALTESRTAWLGAACGGAIILITRTNWRIWLFSFAVLACACGVKELLLGYRPHQVSAYGADVVSEGESVTDMRQRPTNVDALLVWNHQHSFVERLTLIKGSLLMILNHPWSGYGLGSFERQFPEVLAENDVVNPFTVTVKHPHNELLYVWSEGGCLAVVGLLIVFAILFIPLLTWSSRGVVARGAVILPIMVHMLTEYPLYLSAIHGVLLVILFWLALPARWRHLRGNIVKLSGLTCFILQMCVCLFGIGGIVFMVTAIQSAVSIRAIEQQGFQQPQCFNNIVNPLAQKERLQFDRAISELMLFDATHNPKLLVEFVLQAGDWLSRHNDANAIFSMMEIDGYFQKKLEMEKWRKRGCQSFPLDPRFTCNVSGALTGNKK